MGEKPTDVGQGSEFMINIRILGVYRMEVGSEIEVEIYGLSELPGSDETDIGTCRINTPCCRQVRNGGSEGEDRVGEHIRGSPYVDGISGTEFDKEDGLLTRVNRGTD